MGAGGRGATRELTVQVDHLDDRRVCVRAAGELDLATAEELSAQLKAVLTEPRHVVLDLGEVTFMDSTGLAAIIGGLNCARESGGQMEIARPLPAQPQRLLELTGVLERLTFTATPPRPPA
jgi:anti-anti-sigma factor